MTVRQKINIKWSSNLAYAIGLIASDGYLHKDQRHILFSSKDLNQVENFRIALGITNKISSHCRGYEKEKKYFQVTFENKDFYRFLNNIGIKNAKSKNISEVKIPDKYFPDFLRGEFDGDGSFYTQWDKRWPNSFTYHFTIASASKKFVDWLAYKLHSLYSFKAVNHKGKGVYEIRYNKSDSKKILDLIYDKKESLFLERKREKMIRAFDLDQIIKQNDSPVPKIYRLFMPS